MLLVLLVEASRTARAADLPVRLEESARRAGPYAFTLIGTREQLASSFYAQFSTDTLLKVPIQIIRVFVALLFAYANVASNVVTIPVSAGTYTLSYFIFLVIKSSSARLSANISCNVPVILTIGTCFRVRSEIVIVCRTALRK